MITGKKLAIVIAAAVISGFCLGLQPAHAHTGTSHPEPNKEGFQDVLVVPGGAPGRPSYYVSGDMYTFLATGEETDNQFALFKFDVPPGRGPVPHVHGLEAESFYILDGELTVQMGDRDHKMVVTPGTFVYLPKGRPHSFQNRTTTLASTLSLVTPAGLDELFAAAGIPVTNRSAPPPPALPPTPEIVELVEKHGVTSLPPGTSLSPTDGLLDFLVVPPGAPGRESVSIAGGLYTSLATSEETGGLFSLFDVLLPPQAGTGLLQSNVREAESFYVLDGEVTFQVENQSLVATPGTFVYFPIGTNYGFQNLGTTPAKTLLLFTAAKHTPTSFDFQGGG